MISRKKDNHKPSLDGGVLVKVDVNQRWATSSFSHSVLKVIADEANIPLQYSATIVVAVSQLGQLCQQIWECKPSMWAPLNWECTQFASSPELLQYGTLQDCMRPSSSDFHMCLKGSSNQANSSNTIY
ncbi:aminopeptidase I zinc metalloprotease (M18) domain-containing protein [Ditylenchus destructor]|uniref:Aminopeptidase I zinc metalloprotease (M18) domain-containing protein n=1 Tax=Ditylenchus destructor TaxID=166010 RepID=A0AAD4MH33_9BILA|nr:aminopeptidase I zinc metalloprotease (M18) domain-containing protein [Ditylenchus destructor]